MVSIRDAASKFSLAARTGGYTPPSIDPLEPLHTCSGCAHVASETVALRVAGMIATTGN